MTAYFIFVMTALIAVTIFFRAFRPKRKKNYNRKPELSNIAVNENGYLEYINESLVNREHVD